jgi:hypothetical protein
MDPCPDFKTGTHEDPQNITTKGNNFEPFQLLKLSILVRS